MTRQEASLHFQARAQRLYHRWKELGTFAAVAREEGLKPDRVRHIVTPIIRPRRHARHV